MDKLLVIPPYYSGTSFDDIVKGLKVAIQQTGMEIGLLGFTRPFPNSIIGGILDDTKYISGQIQTLKEIIVSGRGRRILFLDFFNPGLDIVKYFHTQKKQACRYGALLHGGSFLSNDLYSWPWLRNFEAAWAGVYGVIYVPSRFLAGVCPINFRKKAKVFPWGLDAYKCLPKSEMKKYDVVFPHRLDADKGIETFIRIVVSLPEINFAVTVAQRQDILRANPYYLALKKFQNVVFISNQSTANHLRTLSQSRVVLSCAKQENFGYAIMKAVLCGAIPVLPRRVCYPEFFADCFLYDNAQQAARLIKKYLSRDPDDKIEKLLRQRVNIIGRYSFVPLLKDFFCK